MRTALAAVALSAFAQSPPRARDLGVPFDGKPGPLNAITDVAGVTVGHATVIRGTSVRTGLTAVWPRGRDSSDPVFGGWFSLNGNGEMTGTAWLDESGFLDGPVLTTNTHSVGVVRDAYIRWLVERRRRPGTNDRATSFFVLPLVAETFDGFLNDTNGFHVTAEHTFQALDSAAAGRVEEGSVGGGTGMICFGFKGGIGTSSRVTGAGHTVGAIVQCNCGRRSQLRIGGVAVGEELAAPVAANQPGIRDERGSIIITVATDAPLLPHQAKRLARRASMGLARTGSVSGNSSGDLFVAFSTANPGAAAVKGDRSLRMLPNEEMDPLFQATVEAVEESIINAMVAARTMTGRDGNTVQGLPHDRLRSILSRSRPAR
jgi:L-aminopeptidase/D-esterase-like protein